MSGNSQSFENMDIIAKANFTVSDLTTAGKLVPDQAKEFIQIAILSSVLLPYITVTPMSAPQKELNKMRFGTSRILGPGKSGSAVPQNQRTKPDLSKTTLTSVLFKGEVRIEDEVFEDNIERQKLNGTIMQLIGEKCGADMEDIAINGDTTSSDLTLAQLDGFIKQQTSNLSASGSVKLTKSILRDLFKTLPREFRRYKKNLAFITSSDAEVDYVDSISSRATVGGDSALEVGRDSPKWMSVPVIGVPLWPNTLGPGNETVVTLTDPKNMTVGVQRDIRLETYRDVSAGEQVYVVSLRMDAKFVHEPASAKATAVQN